MTHDITSPSVVPFPRDLTVALRSRIRETIELIFAEEVEAALGAGPSERVEDRRGYRNGSVTRSVLTQHGRHELTIPRARLFGEDGSTGEWRSELVGRYQRRTKQIDDALVGCYLAGANTRRIRKALAPLFGERHLSKSAISRIVKRLKEEFDRWRVRGLSEEPCAILYLDGFHLPVRMARRVVRVPVLAVIGVRRSDGKKILLSLSIARSESTASWTSVVNDLVRRGLPQPALVVLDGNAGVIRAVCDAWPKSRIQRCTKHKLENLRSKAPMHSHAELKRDYDAIIHAEDLSEAKRSHQAFMRKWRLLSNEVARSLEEAGEDLLSFYSFPPSQWKCLRTTNPLEAVNSGFRRRTKTQGAFPNEDAALVLLYGLIATEQIRLKKIDGWRQLSEVSMPGLQRAA